MVNLATVCTGDEAEYKAAGRDELIGAGGSKPLAAEAFVDPAPSQPRRFQSLGIIHGGAALYPVLDPIFCLGGNVDEHYTAWADAFGAGDLRRA